MEQNKPANVCPNCMEPISDKDVFCMNCGAKLPERKDLKTAVESVCQVCGKPIEPGDTFCMYCGSQVEVPEEISAPEGPVCQSCGLPISPEDTFCMHCGAKIVSLEKLETQKNKPEFQVKPGHMSPASGKAVPPRAEKPETGHKTPLEVPASKKPGKGKLIAVIAAVAVILLVIICVAVLLPEGKNDPGTTLESPTKNLTNEPPESQTPGTDSSGTVQLSSLYIGTWAAKGTTVNDEVNGWQALYLQSVGSNSMTFTLESVQSAPSSRIATTYPITVTIANDQGTFPVNDSWGNTGTGTITLSDSAIHVKVSITSAAPTAMWDIGLDTDFIPENTNFNMTNVPSGSQPPEPNGSSGILLSDLYIGDWEGEDCIIGDNVNGWKKLYLESVDEMEGTITISLEKIYPAPSNQIVGIYHITMPIKNGQCTFRLYDSMENPIEGVLRLFSDVIHVEITSITSNVGFDLSMDTDFSPRRINVRTGNGLLDLEKSPYMIENIILVPMEPVFEAAGIAVFYDDETIVAMTKSHAVALKPFGLGFEYYMDGEYDWPFSTQTTLVDDCPFISLDVLTEFGVQFSWNRDTKTITLSGTIAESDRISAETVERFKCFAAENAVQQVRDAGHQPATEGYDCKYFGGKKSWYIPFLTSAGLKYGVVTYDGQNYQMTEIDY